MSQFEQRANIKFMCRLGKSASGTLSALQQVYGDTALKKSAVYDWFSRFKNGQDKLEDDQRSGRPSRHPEPQKWLKKCDNWFNVIEEWPSWSWNKKLACLTDPFMRFSPTIWRWDASVRSLFRGSWPRIRWNVAWWSLEIFWEKYARPDVSHKDCHGWWVMGVRLRPGDEGAFSRVAHIVVSLTKEITPRQFQGKSYAHCIFWHRRCGAPWFRTAWTDC